jgi:hypothetical protein
VATITGMLSCINGFALQFGHISSIVKGAGAIELLARSIAFFLL